MSQASNKQQDQAAESLPEIPDRNCTWCKIPMKKRLVGGGQFIHYTCPKCIFQHTSKRGVQKA